MPYLERERFGELFVGESDLEIRPDTTVQPDVFVIPLGAKPIGAWSDIECTLLVIEVLSPSTAHYDRGIKRRHYQQAGVDEYWIVDLDSTNGVEVNGRRVKRAQLDPGDTFTVGSTVVTFTTETG